MSLGALTGNKPSIGLPQTPKAPQSPMTSFGTYTPNYTPIPMSDAVKNNINLGWNYQTGQAIQPLSPQLQAGAYTAPIGNLGIKTPTPMVMPGSPTGLLNTGPQYTTSQHYNSQLGARGIMR